MSKRLTEEFVERIKSETDILSVISAYVPLKRKGNNYWGCCPFHHEKTPSFSVKPNEGFFYCFGCHAGGNAFKFLSMVENISYYDAIILQAERLNIPVQLEAQSPQEIARENYIKDLRKVHELAGSFFHNCLTKTGYGKAGLEYFHNRGISDEIIAEFKLGFAPDAWDKLSTAFKKREVSDKLLLDSGLAKQRKGGGLYDTFRNRAMIPITDERGRLVAFGGRVIAKEEPKYLNSPESAIFSKRKMLFCLDKAKKAIQNEGFALVVEGYMDAISVYSAGIHNVVASLGTAFTQEQCRLIMRYGAQLYFCYDSDAAGQNAIIKGLSIARNAGAVVKVVSIPDGKDPDEFIRKHGVEEFRKVIQAAMPMMDFYIKYVTSKLDISRLEGRLQAKNELLPLLAGIKDVAEQNAYIIDVAKRLGIVEGELREQMGRGGYGGNSNRYSASAILNVDDENANSIKQRQVVFQYDDAAKKAVRICIRAVWEEPTIAEHLSVMVPQEFLPDWTSTVLTAVKACAAEGSKPDRDMIMSQLSEAGAEELSRALVEDTADDMVVMYDNCSRYLRKEYLNWIYEQKRQAMMAMENSPEAINYLKEMKKIQHEMDELKK